MPRSRSFSAHLNPYHLRRPITTSNLVPYLGWLGPDRLVLAPALVTPIRIMPPLITLPSARAGGSVETPQGLPQALCGAFRETARSLSQLLIREDGIGRDGFLVRQFLAQHSQRREPDKLFGRQHRLVVDFWKAGSASPPPQAPRGTQRKKSKSTPPRSRPAAVPPATPDLPTENRVLPQPPPPAPAAQLHQTTFLSLSPAGSRPPASTSGGV